MVLKWTRTKPEPLKYFEQELNLNPNRYLKRFDTLLKSKQLQSSGQLGTDRFSITIIKTKKKRIFFPHEFFFYLSLVPEL